jgi:serine protease AprX
MVLGSLLAVLACLAGHSTAYAGTLDPNLGARLAGLPDSADAGVVIVAFDTAGPLDAAHLDVLRAAGITRGLTLPNLGMVALPATAGQVRALVGHPSVRSVWSNERLQYHMHQARVITGVDRVRTDAAITRANGGLPLSGKGDFSVVVNDSGIDATHNDLKLGEKVIQNVEVLADTSTLAGFTPLVTIENVPNTDTVGHGTHCAGILGGTGQMSGGRFEGVAPGAKIIGCGSGAVLFILNGLGGFEYAIANQARYNVRVITNSWGSDGAFNPDDPIQLASRKAYERNIVVLFSASNSGPGRDTHNRYGKAPWVISVAAGTKEGGLASFSSRGTPRRMRLANDDPNDDFDAPTITAPGTGREFETNSGKFTAAIVAPRASTNIFTNGLTDDAELQPADLPFYTQISGTSMATPFTAGVVALLLDADPTLSVDEIRGILTSTASKMPGYEDFEVGAGYINAYAAVDKVLNRSKAYGTFLNPTFNATYTVSGPAPAPFHVDYSPAALPGPGSSNTVAFTVEPGMSVLDVYCRFDNAAESGDGNTIGIVLVDPDGATYSSGISLPILDSPRRQVVVKNPKPGSWRLEVRGVRGLAALPNVSLPTSGAALPGPVDGTITQLLFTLAPIADIQGHPQQAEIETAIKSRLIDTHADGTFQPGSAVTRAGLARVLSYSTAVRQSLANTPRFTDVSADLGAVAEAVTATGSTLRDFDFTPQGMMAASGSTFAPNATVNRLDTAVAFVRALGLDAEARAKANTTVMVGAQAITDNSQIPGALRGYVQIALDRGLFETFPAEIRVIGPGQVQVIPGPRFEPATVMTRSVLAVKLNVFAELFRAGN